MIITVGGLPGTGTTTICKLISENYNLKIISGGEIFRNIAKDMNIDILNLGKIAELNDKIDRKVDSIYKNIIDTEDNIVIDGRLAAYMIDYSLNNSKKILKIWLKAPLEIRVKRILKRENTIFFDKEKEKTIERELSEKKRYKKYYNIDINNLDIYDIVIDTNSFNISQVMGIIKELI